jgi:hypothetical protein
LRELAARCQAIQYDFRVIDQRLIASMDEHLPPISCNAPPHQCDAFVIQLGLSSSAAVLTVRSVYLVSLSSLIAVTAAALLFLLPDGYREPRPEDDPEG